MAEGGACPAHSWLTNLVRLERAWFARSGEGQMTASLRCMARRPEGPGAVPVGKDRSALITSLLVTSTGGGVGSDGTEGGLAVGCFSIILVTMARAIAYGSEGGDLVSRLLYIALAATPTTVISARHSINTRAATEMGGSDRSCVGSLLRSNIPATIDETIETTPTGGKYNCMVTSLDT